MDTLVIDIETKKLLRDIDRDRRRMPELGISVIGVYSYQRDEYRSFREEHFSELESWLESCHQIVGFNLWGFDYPVMEGFLKFDFNSVQTVDLMEDIRSNSGRWVNLNHVASETLGLKKSADGLKAVVYYQEGNWEDLEKYCLDDVRITREVFDFGCQNKFVWVKDRWGLEQMRVNVDWSLEKRVVQDESHSQTQLF